MYYIVLFCSRNNAMRFHDALMREGIDSELINTPKESGHSCGLSVKMYDYGDIRRMLSYANYSSYQGVLRAEQKNGRTYYTKID